MKRSGPVLLCAVLFAGCGGGSNVMVPHVDLPPAEEDLLDRDTRGAGQDLPGGDSSPGLDVSGDVPDIGGACTPGHGCFLDPCLENGDCLSGLCVTHMGDQVCTMECLEECPDGWTCQQVHLGPDLMFACVSNFPFLCMPCHQDVDCTATWGGQSVCVDSGPAGRFCGGSCGPSLPCP
ncbi:MAG: hypothetical protein FJ098_04130, partial [Deltaproteobacteria bacterium]|nr:hypothetical protein [Deltaproteobacteria bacterium]